MSFAEPYQGGKTTTFRLSIGNRIALTSQEERMLRIAYEYLAGFAKRSQKEQTCDKKKEEVTALFTNLPPAARVQIRERSQTAKGTGEILLVGTKENLWTEHERRLDEFLRAKGELQTLEDDLKSFSLTDHKISMKDLDAALRKFGTVMSKKELEVSFIVIYVTLFLL